MEANLAGTLEGILVATFGLAVGSFLSCAADRLPSGRSLLTRSCCAACARLLTARELVPVGSYLWLRGRCHGCATPIPARAPLIEAGTAALALVCWITLGPTLAALAAFGQLAVLGLITVIDLEHRRVLNRLVLPALPLTALATSSWPGLSAVDSLLGGLAGFGTLLLVALLRPGALGMGDVKLAALTGLLTGLSHLVTALLAAFIGGGAVAIVLLLTGRIGRRDALPFAPFLCLGTIVALLL